MVLIILFGSYSKESNGDVTMTSITLWRHINTFSCTDCSDTNIVCLASVAAGFANLTFVSGFLFYNKLKQSTRYPMEQEFSKSVKE